MTGVPVRYRESLDGIRAIAVLFVLLFHLDRDWLPGGFVGVDMFFVLSGYLITSIIQHEIDEKKFGFKRFYQRRVARIFPAFFLVVIFVLVASSIVFTSQDFASQGAVTTAASLSVTNLKFMLQGNYFQTSPDSQPLLHYWSLAIEEQFYLVFPGFLFLVSRLKSSVLFRKYTFSFITIVSFSICVWMTMKSPTFAFYLLPTRSWELLAGGYLAIHAGLNREIHDSLLQRILGPIGIAIIVASGFLIGESLRFPGFIAGAPVVGAMLVIGFSHHPNQPVERMLSIPFLAYIGKLSYSLYLWHWPIICFVDYRFCDYPPALLLVGKVLSISVLSVLCFQYVETPARNYFAKERHAQKCFLLFFLCSVIICFSGIAIRNNFHVTATHQSVYKGGISFGDEYTDSIVLMGDSNGSMYGTSVDRISRSTKHQINVISVEAANVFSGDQVFAESVAYLEKAKPKFVIYACLWSKTVDEPERIIEAVSEIKKHSEFVLLISQPPKLPFEGTRAGKRADRNALVLEDPIWKRKRELSNQLLQTLVDAQVAVVDVDSIFMKSNGELITNNEHGRLMFQDPTHLSNHGADVVADKIIDLINRNIE